MEKTYSLLKPLTDQLMKDVRAYGILEVSTEQYQTSCNQILNFAQLSQIDHYSPELIVPPRFEFPSDCKFAAN